MCSSGPQEQMWGDTGWTGPGLQTDLGAIAVQFEAPRSRRRWAWTEGSRGQGPGLRQASVQHGGWGVTSRWEGAGEEGLARQRLHRVHSQSSVAGREERRTQQRDGPHGALARAERASGYGGRRERRPVSPVLRSVRGKQRPRAGTRGERGLGFSDRTRAPTGTGTAPCREPP